MTLLVLERLQFLKEMITIVKGQRHNNFEPHILSSFDRGSAVFLLLGLNGERNTVKTKRFITALPKVKRRP